jgi:hypothetical protein
MAQIDGSRLSIGSCCLWYAVIFVGYMLCVFCLLRLIFVRARSCAIVVLSFSPTVQYSSHLSVRFVSSGAFMVTDVRP